MESRRSQEPGHNDANKCKNLSEIYLGNLSDDEMNLFLAAMVINIFSSVVTVIMNAMIISILVKISRVHDIVYPILCDICGTGLFAGIVVQPLHVVNDYPDSKVFQHIWPCLKIPSVIFATAFHLTGYGVLASLALLSFYHLQAVSDPAKFRTRYTVKRSRRHVAYLWIWKVIFTASSEGIFWNDPRVPQLIFYIGASLLVLTIIVIQLWTFISLKTHNRNMLSPETDSLQVALVVKRAKKMSKTNAMIFVSLVILCLPVVMVAVVNQVISRTDRTAKILPKDRNTFPKTLLMNTKILTFLFPAVYPFILLFMNKKFSKEAAKILKSLKLCKRTSRSVDITVLPAGQVTHSRTGTIPTQNENVSIEVLNHDDVSSRRLQISTATDERTIRRLFMPNCD